MPTEEDNGQKQIVRVDSVSGKEVADLYQELISSHKPSKPTTVRTSIENEITRERKLQNDDAEQDIRLKRITLTILFGFLAVETALIFWFTFLQATHVFEFHLDEWSFKLVVSATLTQITAMIFVAVNYLFPKKSKS